MTRPMKVDRPNPVVTWETVRPPTHIARGLLVDAPEGLYVKKRGRCRLASCEQPAAEEVAPMIDMCVEHTAQFHRMWEERRASAQLRAEAASQPPPEHVAAPSRIVALACDCSLGGSHVCESDAAYFARKRDEVMARAMGILRTIWRSRTGS